MTNLSSVFQWFADPTHWSGTDGILHVVFASRRGMLPSVRAVIDFVAAALKSSTGEQEAHERSPGRTGRP